MKMIIERLKNMSLTGYAVFLAVLVGAGLVGFVLVARTVNTHPGQCASCHPEMTQLFKESKAHPADRVTCFECHAQHPELPEGFNIGSYVRDLFIPEKYLSSDERLESHCLECHKSILKSEKEKGKLIKVNHKVHLAKELEIGEKKVRLGCMDCHSTVAHDRTGSPTNRPLMAGCFAAGCHEKDRNKDSCLRCHYQVLTDKVEAAAPAPAPAQAEGEKPK